MVVNGSLAGPEIHFELRYYFAINELFITNFYCIYTNILCILILGTTRGQIKITRLLIGNIFSYKICLLILYLITEKNLNRISIHKYMIRLVEVQHLLSSLLRKTETRPRRQSPYLFNRLQGVFYVHIAATHMDSNPEPSDHELHTMHVATKWTHKIHDMTCICTIPTKTLAYSFARLYYNKLHMPTQHCQYLSSFNKTSLNASHMNEWVL